MELSKQDDRFARFACVALVLALALTCSFAPAASAQSADSTGLDLICPLAEHERQRKLADLQLDLALAENELEARRNVFDMVDSLWSVRSIEKEIFLDYKRLRDRTRVRVARVNAEIAQQKSIVERYALACSVVRGEKTARDVARRIALLDDAYRRSDCDLHRRDAEIAEVDLEYDAAVLESTRTLARDNIKTKFELMVEQYDLNQSKARAEGFRKRARACEATLVN